MSLSAQNNASCDAFIHNVPESVGETAFHAYNLAIGNVFTWEIVQCHAEHHVIDFPVMSVVLSFLNVGIDVLLYVAKFVPQVAFAKYAVVEGKNWWDLLNSARSIWTKIQLLCFHANISTRRYLDEMFEIRKAYVRNENGQYFKSVQMGCLWLQPKQCLQCSMQISNFHRYNHNIKRTLLDNILRCTIIRSEEQFVAVSRNIDTFEIELEKNRKNALESLASLAE